jgi:hypothetical protein
MVIIAAITHLVFFPLIKLLLTGENLHGVYRIFGFDPTPRMFQDAESVANFTQCLLTYSSQICYESNDNYPYSIFSSLVGFLYIYSWSWIPFVLQLIIMYQLYTLLNRLNLDLKIFTVVILSPSFMMLMERGNVDQLSLILMLTLANNYRKNSRFIVGSILTLVKSTNIGFIIFLSRFTRSLVFAVGLVLASYGFNLPQILSLWNRRSPIPYGSFGVSILSLSSLLILFFSFMGAFLVLNASLNKHPYMPNLAVIENKEFWLMSGVFYSLTYFSGPNVLYHLALFIPFFILIYRQLLPQYKEFADFFLLGVTAFSLFSSIRFLVTAVVLFYCLNFAAVFAKRRINNFVGMLRGRRF